MKQINVCFEDKNYKLIVKVKKTHGGNWHDFILDIVRQYEIKDDERD